MAHAGMSICAAAANISPMRLAPSSIEYSVWACRCTKLKPWCSSSWSESVNYSGVFRTPTGRARAGSPAEVGQKRARANAAPLPRERQGGALEHIGQVGRNLVDDAAPPPSRGVRPRQPPGVQEGPAPPERPG